MSKVRIYTASKTKHADRWRRLRAQGYEIISTWIDEAGEGETTNRRGLAERCIEESKNADCLLLYCEAGDYLKGAFIEIGAALAAYVPIFAVGKPLPDSSVFCSHRLWFQFETLDDALQHIEKWEIE